MPIDCANPPCERVLPASTIISVFGDSSTPANTDCSTNLLYLTDEAGLINQANAASGVYLSASNRLRQVSSVQEIELHFSKCSRTFYELSAFFSWSKGVLIRPRTITLAYFDSSAETMLEALQAIYDCYTCFYTVTHVSYDKNGAALFDTNAQLALAEWGSAYATRMILPTANQALAIDPSETTSIAYQAKQKGYREAVFQLLNEQCIDALDANCESTGAVVNSHGVQHLLMAGVIASISADSADYRFNVKFKPIGGIKLTKLSTAQLTQEELYYATGSNPHLDGVQPLWPHHINVYHNVSGYRMLMEGLTATGDFIDERVHRRYIEDRLNKDLMSLLVGTQVVSMVDTTQLRTTLTTTIRDLIRKGLISDTPKAINKDDFENIFLSGNGWVLTKAPTEQKHLDTRITPTYIFCYVREGGVNYISIGLCKGLLGEVI